MRHSAAIALLCIMAALGGCNRSDSDRPETARAFPRADRPVSQAGASQFSTEDQRDRRGEAESVMKLAEIEPGMVVADIGAGEGYYTVRLADKVGPKGRVLAEDINREVLTRLGNRVVRDRLDNVSIKLGAPENPKLPVNSFDRIFMVHMYHEITEPYAFLWNLWPALKPDGLVVVVDVDRPTDRHGIPPMLLACEFQAVGYKFVAFKDSPHLAGYYAQFERAAKRPKPEDIKPCRGASAVQSAKGG